MIRDNDNLFFTTQDARISLKVQAAAESKIHQDEEDEPLAPKGARVLRMSPEYKYALREFHLVSHVSEKKFSQAQGGIVWETMKELHAHGLLKDEHAHSRTPYPLAHR